MAIAKIRPTKNADGTLIATPDRSGAYKEAYIIPMGIGRYGYADEGSYYTATNATVGTALTAHVAPSIANTDTKSIIHFFNAGTLDVYLDYIWMKQTIVNASSTAADYMVYVDTAQATAKTSGGTVIVPNNVRSNSTNTTAIVLTAGAVLTTFTTSRKLMQRTVRPVISVAEDQYAFVFGTGHWLPSAVSHIGTAVASIVVSCPPVVVGPGGNFGFVQTGPSGATTAATFEFEMGYWER